jgi:hypothetical protein
MIPVSFIPGSMRLILVAMKRLSWDSLFRREQVLMKAPASGSGLFECASFGPHSLPVLRHILLFPPSRPETLIPTT